MDNFEIKGKSIYLSVNPKIYPLDVIYSAAYIFTDENYIILDGNPEEEILIQIKPKKTPENMEKIAQEFNNELLNYAAYAAQSQRNASLRALFMQRVVGAVQSPPLRSANASLSSDSKPWLKNAESKNQ
jgi:His-Xaa-Ser system protein HxsD